MRSPGNVIRKYCDCSISLIPFLSLNVQSESPGHGMADERAHWRCRSLGVRFDDPIIKDLYVSPYPDQRDCLNCHPIRIYSMEFWYAFQCAERLVWVHRFHSCQASVKTRVVHFLLGGSGLCPALTSSQNNLKKFLAPWDVACWANFADI